jgi:hypothetical protein
MKSAKHGKRTSDAEEQGVLKGGVWLLVRGNEYFLPFAQHPWFKNARISSIQRVKLLSGQHLYWPELDIDLTIESLEHPERYPLTYR